MRRWNHSKNSRKKETGPEKSNKNSSEANPSVQHMGVSAFPSRAAPHAPGCSGGAALMWLQQPLPPWLPPPRTVPAAWQPVGVPPAPASPAVRARFARTAGQAVGGDAVRSLGDAVALARARYGAGRGCTRVCESTRGCAGGLAGRALGRRAMCRRPISSPDASERRANGAIMVSSLRRLFCNRGRGPPGAGGSAMGTRTGMETGAPLPGPTCRIPTRLRADPSVPGERAQGTVAALFPQSRCRRRVSPLCTVAVPPKCSRPWTGAEPSPSWGTSSPPGRCLGGALTHPYPPLRSSPPSQAGLGALAHAGCV